MKPKLVPNAARVLKRSLSLRMIEAFVAITLLDLAASLAPAIASYLLSIRRGSSAQHPSAGRWHGLPGSCFNLKTQEIEMPINKLRATPRATALIASIVAATAAGYVAVFPGQAKVHDDVALAIKVAGPWEGRQLIAYLDTLPNPPRWTLCDGDTDEVKPRQRATPAECEARIAKTMEARYRPGLVACPNISNWTADRSPSGG